MAKLTRFFQKIIQNIFNFAVAPLAGAWIEIDVGLTPYHARQIKFSAQVRTELEMLLIIAEKLTGAYEKVKSNMKLKDFAKANIKCGKKKYDNSTSFYTDYFGGNPELLVRCIKEYKKYNGSHGKDEHYLAELLK